MKLQSFWKVLSEESVQIPLFQRDYAQGRYEKEALRTKFVQRLFEALRFPADNAVKLDFMFGVRNDFSVFQPLDGQQRLTTLWLLHWYVAQRAGKGSCAKSVLQKFSYETRESSAQFCHALVEAEGWDGSEVERFIKRQRWYFDRYELDPSVRGFLRTLNTIERCACDQDDFSIFWTRLTSVADCPILFFVRDDMPESVADSLYIKMNSRGKGLTEFENFKADMLGLELPGHEHIRLFTAEDAALVDNDWTDIFWAHQQNEEVDDIFFQFIKRYLLAWRIAETGEGGRQDTKTIDAILGEELYRHLHDGQEYVSIKPYTPALVVEMKKDLRTFFSAYKACKDVFGEVSLDQMVAPYWLRDNEAIPFTLIPRYEQCENLDEVLHGKLLQGLPVLYSACRFLEKNLIRIQEVKDAQQTSHAELKDEFACRFKRWMRFVWNLTDGSFAHTDDTMVPLVRLLREISDLHTWDIDIYLASCDISQLDRKTARLAALAAEIQKAKLRQYERVRIQNHEETYDWGARIAHAEEIGFLHGEIEFLLSDEAVNEYLSGGSAHVFDTQIEHMEKYFGNSGISAVYAIPLAKALMKGMDHFKKKDGAYGFYDNEFLCRTDVEAWRETILRDPVMSRSVARALAIDNLDMLSAVPFVDVDAQKTGESGEDRLREDLLKSGILDLQDIIGPDTKSSWRFRAYETVSFYRKTGAGKNGCVRFYFDTCPMTWVEGCRRNEYLLSGDPVFVRPEDYREDVSICAPQDRFNTCFSYQDPQSGQLWRFSWHLNNWIYLTDENWKPFEDKSFQFKYEMTREQFIGKLKELIN